MTVTTQKGAVFWRVSVRDRLGRLVRETRHLSFEQAVAQEAAVRDFIFEHELKG